jgi:two-component system LytT family response regulator
MDMLFMQKRLPVMLPNASIKLIPCHKIKFIKANRNYSEITVDSDEVFTHTRCLKSFTSRLCGDYFIRCHKSYIVNTLFIEEIRKKDKQIVMDCGKILPCSNDAINKLIEAVSI